MPSFFKEEADEVYSSKDLYEKFGLNPNMPCADWYFHHKTCVWIVEEEKTRNKILEGIRQLEITVTQLKRIRKPVDRIQLRVKSIGGESKIYGRDFEGHLIKKLGKFSKKILIEGMPIHILVGG